MTDKKFNVLNVTCDYYLDSLNDLSKLKYHHRSPKKSNNNVQYTVMRIFGITETGSKCCVHVHGFLPYIIFRTKSRLNSKLRTFFVQIIQDIISQTHFSKLCLDVDRDVIFDIYDEQGFSMYGYYEKKDYFIRVVFYDPRILRICAYAFQKNEYNVSSYIQPYNAHISTVLQFFIDFGIYGMDFLCLSSRYQRLKISKNQKEDTIKWDENLKKSPLKPQSNMELEFDVFTDDIFNQFETTKSHFNIQGLQFIWEEEQKRCKLSSIELESFIPSLNIGIPEVWTEHEEALKNDLKIVLLEIKKNLQHTDNILNNNSYLSDFSVLNSQGHLSQNVRDDINTQILLNEKLPHNDYLSFVIESENLITNNNNKNSIFYDIIDEDEYIDENESADLNNLIDFPLNEVNFNHIKYKKSIISESNLESSSSDESIQLIEQHSNIIKNKINNDINDKVKFSNKLKNSSLIICNNDKNNLFLKNDILCHSNDLISVKKKKLFDKSITITDTLYETLSYIEKPIEEKQNNLTQDEYLNKSTVNNLCVLSVEILALSTNFELRNIADPKYDCILAIFYAIDTDVCNRSNKYNVNIKPENRQFCGKIALSTLKDLPSTYNNKKNEIAPIFVSHEFQLFAELTNIVQRYNPDILIGYDISRFSWGYIYDRARFLGLPFIYNISRIKNIYKTKVGINQIKCECFNPPHGRIQLEVWKILKREDTSLHTYQFSSVVKIILKREIAELKPEAIINALKNTEKNNVLGVKELILNYFLNRCILNIDLLDKLDFFIKTSQMARVYGIQFLEVLTRGLQFRIESILMRLAARKKFMCPSITDKQRNLMDSPETIPLNIEPDSGIYYDPIIVLDFQSLYPSICIAYNYCFTTCIGKLSRFKFLANQLSENPQSLNSINFTLGAINNFELYDINQTLKLLDNNLLNISPAGGIFLKMQKRKSLLAEMLYELLETRVMIKKSIKNYIGCEKLIRLLDARQLALKLVANATYGYTAASWSGRMPCEELADAIVSKGRETLERTIQYIHENSLHTSNNKTNHYAKYGNARVIYGDTDSLFILLKGHSRSDAFYIGNKIANEITAANPYPIKLKLEKVMQPCILITKKRYVGMSYENNDQTIPKFDAKGIETVRRDVCEFVSKTMENVLKLLLDVKLPKHNTNEIETLITTKNKYNGELDAALNYLKYRLKHLWKIPLNEFILSNEFHDNYALNAVLPVKKIAEELKSKSPRLMPISGERISYLIVTSNTVNDEKKNYSSNIFGSSAILTGSVTSNAVLIDDYLSNSNLEINYDYYVTKKLFPALMRIFQFTGIRLKWQSGKANRIYCLGCLTPNFYPWCLSCTKSARGLVLRRKMQSLKYFLIRKNCRLCLCPSKSIQNIEDLLAFNLCNNFDCQNRQALMHAERIILPNEFKCHIASHSLNFFNYF